VDEDLIHITNQNVGTKLAPDETANFTRNSATSAPQPAKLLMGKPEAFNGTNHDPHAASQNASILGANACKPQRPRDYPTRPIHFPEQSRIPRLGSAAKIFNEVSPSLPTA